LCNPGAKRGISRRSIFLRVQGRPWPQTRAHVRTARLQRRRSGVVWGHIHFYRPVEAPLCCDGALGRGKVGQLLCAMGNTVVLKPAEYTRRTRSFRRCCDERISVQGWPIAQGGCEYGDPGRKRVAARGEMNVAMPSRERENDHRLYWINSPWPAISARLTPGSGQGA